MNRMLLALLVAGVFGGVLQAEDPYEPNNSRAAAYDLSLYEQTWLSSINGYGEQHDADWYRIHADVGSERFLIRCTFAHSAGDIDMALYDDTGGLLATASTSEDEEIIDTTVPADGDYFVQLYWGNGGNTYDLWWDDLDTGGGPAPDLAVTSVTVSSYSIDAGDTIDVHRIYTNSGAAAAGPFFYGVYLSENTLVTTGDTQLYQYYDSDGLGAGLSDNQTITGVTVPAGTATGNYYVGVIVDDEYTLTESDEDNNTGFDPVQIYVQGSTGGGGSAGGGCAPTRAGPVTLALGLLLWSGVLQRAPRRT